MSTALNILNTLNDHQGYPMADQALYRAVKMDEPALTVVDFNHAVAMLEGRGEILGVANPDVKTKWSISDAGKLRLANI